MSYFNDISLLIVANHKRWSYGPMIFVETSTEKFNLSESGQQVTDFLPDSGSKINLSGHGLDVVMAWSAISLIMLVRLVQSC